MMGLAELRARTREGDCPFCGEAMPERPAEARGRKPKYCGAPECWVAYHRLYKRDARDVARRKSRAQGSRLQRNRSIAAGTHRIVCTRAGVHGAALRTHTVTVTAGQRAQLFCDTR